MGTTAVNGVTYVNPTGPVRFADIAAAFGSDVNQASELRNRKWYKSDFTRGNFPSSGNLSLSALRGTGGNIPRISSADRATYTSDGLYKSSGGFTLPNGFNTITIVVYGASGGGGGQNGSTCVQFGYIGPTFTCVQAVSAAGGSGGSGGATSMTLANGAQPSAQGGGGGNQGSNGTNGTNTVGITAAAGGSGNGNGGSGGVSRYDLNADTAYASISALFGSTFTPTYGTAGAAGVGGGTWQVGANGSPGTTGFVAVFIDQNLY